MITYHRNLLEEVIKNNMTTSMTYTVTAKQYGNSIQFEVFAENIKEALASAKLQAKENFEVTEGQEIPTVSVKLSKDQGGA
jgi:hypothetical protein